MFSESEDPGPLKNILRVPALVAGSTLRSAFRSATRYPFFEQLLRLLNGTSSVLGLLSIEFLAMPGVPSNKACDRCKKRHVKVGLSSPFRRPYPDLTNA